MREKISELTRSGACMSCHSMINPLGFSLEHYDAVGRFRTKDGDKTIDASADYTTDDGRTFSGREAIEAAIRAGLMANRGSKLDITADTVRADFNDLLTAARGQPDAQRLLLVFAGATLPPDATPEQRASFEAGESGELSPLMCVDKDPAALADFAALCDEAAAMGQPWVLVFAAALSGAGQHPLASSQIDSALRTTGKAVLFTSLTLIVSVAMWLFSGLQFQADMGLLLVFMFTANLLGALLMLPALAWLCSKFLPMKPQGGIAIQ